MKVEAKVIEHLTEMSTEFTYYLLASRMPYNIFLYISFMINFWSIYLAILLIKNLNFWNSHDFEEWHVWSSELLMTLREHVLLEHSLKSQNLLLVGEDFWSSVVDMWDTMDILIAEMLLINSYGLSGLFFYLFI